VFSNQWLLNETRHQERAMAGIRPTSNLIAFPKRDKRRKTSVNNWVFRIVENNDDLVSALSVILESYKSVVAGQPVSHAEVIRQVEHILTIARDVRWNAIW
jgi:hypothetical protein